VHRRRTDTGHVNVRDFIFCPMLCNALQLTRYINYLYFRSYRAVLVERPVSVFVCSRPVITSSTSSLNVAEGSDVLLTCTAAADPTPNVRWQSPFGDVVSVTPPDDRQQQRLSAVWQIRRARPHHSGWYWYVQTPFS